MSELADVAGGQVISAAYTNQVKERTAMRYASAAARDTSLPVPEEGALAYLADVNALTLYAGAFGWLTLLVSDGSQEIDGTLTATGFRNSAATWIANEDGSMTAVDLRINALPGDGLLVKAGDSPGAGGQVMIGSVQADHFAAIAGSLVDGLQNSIGDLQFLTRNTITDATLAERMRIQVNGNISMFHDLTVLGVINNPALDAIRARLDALET